MPRSSLLRPASWAALILGVLAGCASQVPLEPPPGRQAPVEQAPAPAPAPSTSPAAPVPPAAVPPVESAASAAAPAPGVVRDTGISRWVAVPWSELPGWSQDNVLAAWPALLKSCERPAPGWAAACAEARTLTEPDEAKVRAWLQARLAPWRIEAPDGQAEGLITGYYEPLIEASRVPKAGFKVPLYAPPADLATRKPWYTREQLEREPAARAGLRGREIAYVADPLDALVLHIQGSGRLAITEPDGRRQLVRAAFAGHNEQPYKSVGRWLVDRGALTLEQASWPAIKSWARTNPRRVGEMLNANPRYVFFREEPLHDPTQGPRGAQGVALTPGRSIAVDKASVPYGSPVWIATTEPPPPGATVAAAAAAERPLQRLVIAQDTGGAITGPVRADYFWGWGEGAEALAGRMKQPLRMWVLWPKS